MRGRSLRRLIIVVALTVAVATGAARADSSSGPERTTLIPQPWGTVFHLPLPSSTTIAQDMFGEYTIKAGGGATTSIKQEGYNAGYVVYYPDESSLTVRVDEGGEIRFDMRGAKGYLRPTGDGWVMRLPDDEIRLRKRGSEVTLSGRLGATRVVDDANGFTVTSPAGETRYGREAFDEPFALRGVPLQSHPYVVRGVWLEAFRAGVFIDFRLSAYSRAFALLGWHPMITIGGK